MGRNSWTEVITPEAEKAPVCLQEKIRAAIVAIDNELGTVKNEEYRQVLVTTGYALRNLSQHIQHQQLLKAAASETISPVC